MDHIEITRINNSPRARRKPNRRPPPNEINTDIHESHGVKLSTSYRDEVNRIKKESERLHFDPHLVIKMEIGEDFALNQSLVSKLESFDLEIINEETKNLQVLFSDNIELESFVKAMEDYKEGKIAKTKIKNVDLFSIISEISPWSKEDRLGIGIDRLLVNDCVDCYLWNFEYREENLSKSDEFKKFIDKNKLHYCDDYIGTSFSVFRIKITDPAQIDILAENVLVYKIEKAPRFSFSNKNIHLTHEINVDDFEVLDLLDEDESSKICVIDSGIFQGQHFLKGVVGDSKSFYLTGELQEDTHDYNGHGTSVASICEYGNLFDCVDSKTLKNEIYLLNAKIHNGTYKEDIEQFLAELSKRGIELTEEQEFFIECYFEGTESLFEIQESQIFNENTDLIIEILLFFTGYFEKLIPNQMLEIVNYFVENYDCKIFNLSQGAIDLIYTDGKPRSWACILDEIQNEYDVLFVVSAGNIDKNDISLEDYPEHYFKEQKYRLIEPANSVSSITVGSIGYSGVPNVTSDETLRILPISSKNYISSFTRVGPGFNSSVKPDFVYHGGDYCFNSLLQKPIINQGTSILTLGNSFSSLFSSNIGTSLSAPYVSHLCGKILNKYNLSCNAIRALLAVSSYYPQELESQLEDLSLKSPEGFSKIYLNKTKDKIHREKIQYYTCGYGIPSILTCLDSTENNVILTADMSEQEQFLDPDSTHIFKIPIPVQIHSKRCRKRITIALAFSPPVKKTRLDYMGTQFNFNLIKGKSLHEVYDVFSSQKGKSDLEKMEMIPDRFHCDLKPGANIRNRGTLLKGVYTFTAKNNREHGDEYFLVVNCIKKWSSSPIGYATAIRVEVDDTEIELYNTIKERVDTRVRESEKVLIEIK